MSPKLRRLSGKQVLSTLNHFGFQVLSQRGSHVKLHRINAAGAKETITVPIHDELDVGTLHAIFRQTCKYIPEEELRPYFYSD